MNISIIDWIIIIGFFIVLVFVAKWATGKVKNKEDYLLAGKSLGRLPTALSTAATDFGGSGLVGCAGLAYTFGIAGGWWDLAAAPSWIILGFTVAGAFQRLEVFTVPEFLERRYNTSSRVIAAFASLISSAFSTTAQLTVSALALSSITGLGKSISLLIVTALVIAYTMTGGLLSVVWTDVMQYFILMGGIILAIPFSIHAAGGWNNIVATVPASFWDMGAMGMSEPAGWVLMGFFSYGVNQTFVQRLFAAKDPATARFSYVYTGINYIFYAFIVSLLGICARVIIPDLADPEMAITELIRLILPTGVRGLLLAAIFAATISTATSILNACSSLFTIDIYKRLIRPQSSERHILLVARLATLFLALISLLGSLVLKRVVSMVVWAGLIYAAGVFFPVICGLRWRRLNGTGAICGIVGGGIMGVVSNAFLFDKVGGIFGSISPYFLGAGVSLILLIAVSLLTPPPPAEKSAHAMIAKNR